jgi:hypothetical protein
MRDVEVVDLELALLVAVRCVVRELGACPTSGAVDRLLDERLRLLSDGSDTPSE